MVLVDSSISPGRFVASGIQSMLWPGPATNPSSDMEKCHSTLPAAVWGLVSSMVGSLRLW